MALAVLPLSPPHSNSTGQLRAGAWVLCALLAVYPQVLVAGERHQVLGRVVLRVPVNVVDVFVVSESPAVRPLPNKSVLQDIASVRRPDLPVPARVAIPSTLPIRVLVAPEVTFAGRVVVAVEESEREATVLPAPNTCLTSYRRPTAAATLAKTGRGLPTLGRRFRLGLSPRLFIGSRPSVVPWTEANWLDGVLVPRQHRDRFSASALTVHSPTILDSSPQFKFMEASTWHTLH